MPGSTTPFGPSGAFPDTRFSIVRATGADDPRLREDAWAILIRSYWKPVYKYIRIKWRSSEADAQDLTQEFFTRALDAGFFRRFDPSRARFRTYLRVCVHGFVANEFKAASRKKRGGDYRMHSLDFEGAERELRNTTVSPDIDPDEFFRQESIRALFGDAVAMLRETLEAAGKSVHMAVFERYDLAEADAGPRPTYRDLAEELDLPVTQVTNYLAYARREFRRIVLDRLREISGTEHEFRLEAIDLLGMDPGDPPAEPR
jgi:RNA polymerase sigma factor (sigma-70 family)